MNELPYEVGRHFRNKEIEVRKVRLGQRVADPMCWSQDADAVLLTLKPGV